MILCRYITFLSFQIPSYGLFLCLAIFLSGFFILRRAQWLGINFEDMIVIMAVSVAVSIIFGGLLYILVTYSPQQIWQYVQKRNFSFLFHSGLVFYGSLFGGIIGAIVSGRLLRVNLARAETAIVPFLPLGHAVGRVGCMMAGCCYGIKYEGFFAVKNQYAGGFCFPVQAVEAFFNLCIMAVLLKRAGKDSVQHRLLSLYLVMYSAVRFFVEFLRGDLIRGLHYGLSTSQWISLAIMVICLSITIWHKYANN